MFGRSTQSDMVLGLLVASICLLCQTQAESVDGFEIGGECGSCAAGQFCQKKNKLYEELRSDIVASGNVDADAVAHDQALWAKYFPAEKAGTRRLTEGLAALEAIDVCLPCPTGKFQSKTRQYKCLVCPAGTYSVLISRKFGAGKSLHVMAANPPTSCSDCPAGKATTVGKCKSCAPGQFAGGAGTPICKKCREGTFQNKPGKENCRHCVGMSFTSVPGETSCTACTCPRGQFISHLKQCICLDCANGRFMPNKFRNHSTCENCPSGKWRDVSIGEHCSDCEPGTLSNVAKTSCIQSCPANTYRNSQQNGCVGCPTGKFLFEKRTTDYRSSTCVAKCPTGTFADGFSCITCSAGSFHSVSSASCLKCPAGKYQLASGSSSCTMCVIGQFLNEAGSSHACDPCSLGRFASSKSSARCSDCPNGKFTDRAGSYECSWCSPGQFTMLDHSHCHECPKGQYNSKLGGKCTGMTKVQEADAASRMHDQLLLLQGRNVPVKEGNHSGLKIMALLFCIIPVIIGFVYVVPTDRDEDIRVIGESESEYGAAKGGAQVHDWRV